MKSLTLGCLRVSAIFLLPLFLRADALDNWTVGTFPCTNKSQGPNTFGYAQSVAFGNGTFVAGGTYSCPICSPDLPSVLWLSSNGSDWTESTPLYYQDIPAITYADGRFVGVLGGGLGGAGAFILGGPATFSLADVFYDVAYGNGRYVAVGVGPMAAGGSPRRTNIWYSSNGSTWSSTLTYWPASTANPPVTKAVAFGNGYFLAVSLTNSPYAEPPLEAPELRFARMTNFLNNWPQRLVYFPNSSAITPFPAVTDLAFGQGNFVLVGSKILVVTNQNLDADNAITLPAITPPTANVLRKVIFGGGMFVAATRTEILTSLDGYAWVNRGALFTSGGNAAGHPSEPKQIKDIAFGNNRFVVVAGTNFFVSDPVSAAVAQRPSGRLQLTGIAGRNHEIEASSTLASNSWQVVTNIVLTNPPQIWTDPQGEVQPKRFYRTRLLP